VTTEHEPSRRLVGRALDLILEPATAVSVAWLAALAVVVHTDPLLATLMTLGAAGAFVAGLVGVGGAIVMIPLLLYVPPLIGTGRLTMHEVAGATMVQVMAASASGVAGHLREGAVSRVVVVTLGSGAVAGSLAGGLLSRWMNADLLQGVFAAMAAAAAVIMIAFNRRPEPETGAPVLRRRGLGFVLALGVGLLAGAVGAGGAFLLVPLMLYVLRIPARIAVGSSLAVALAAAVSGVIGKLLTLQIPGWPALALVAGALPGGQLGAAVSKRLRVEQLRTVLAILIAAVAVKMWWDILR
jgi:uncharacterized protein